MRKRKTLSSFIPPLYSDARTGQIVTTEAKETTGHNKEQASMTMPTDTTTLPELKSGALLVSRKGEHYRAYRVSKPKRDLYAEPMYRLEKVARITVRGNGEFSLEELAEAGMKLVE